MSEKLALNSLIGAGALNVRFPRFYNNCGLSGHDNIADVYKRDCKNRAPNGKKKTAPKNRPIGHGKKYLGSQSRNAVSRRSSQQC